MQAHAYRFSIILYMQHARRCEASWQFGVQVALESSDASHKCLGAHTHTTQGEHFVPPSHQPAPQAF